MCIGTNHRTLYLLPHEFPADPRPVSRALVDCNARYPPHRDRGPDRPLLLALWWKGGAGSCRLDSQRNEMAEAVIESYVKENASRRCLLHLNPPLRLSCTVNRIRFLS